jgi:hypothetical protein
MPFRWRPDGDYVPDIPATRRIMPYIMRTRTESAVYFEQQVETAKTLDYIKKKREETGLQVTMLHVLLLAASRTLDARPRLNRFTAGGRIYQRRGIQVSFSAKKAKNDDAPIAVVKQELDPSWPMEELVRRCSRDVDVARSDTKTSTDKELGLLFLLPGFLVSAVVSLFMKLDHWGLMPGFVLRQDPMFASMFIANLGSIGMDAGFHHLFEYGNIPIFLTVGQSRTELKPTAEGGVEARPVMVLRYSFDERVEDGLYCARALELFKGFVEDPGSMES